MLGDGHTPACLSDPQVQALQILAGPVLLADGKQVYPAFAPGALLADPAVPPATGQVGLGFMRNFVFNDPNWDPKNFNLDRDFATTEVRLGATLESANPDLRPFFKQHGKLIIYHGLSDSAVSPFTTTQYMAEVHRVSGSAVTDASSRVYLVPGMEHCAGGAGTDTFGSASNMDDAFAVDPQHNLLLALEAWVDHNTAPGTIIAAHKTAGSVDRTRPLCAAPQIAKYRGSGSTDDAANFTCTAP